MPTYQIQAPDGNSYRIDGPPGATKDEIISRISAKFPQATKPKDAGGPSALGIAKSVGAGALDVAGGLLNPKELGREAYHTVTDWAGHTIAAADDLADWLSDKTGFYQLKIGPGGIRSVGQAEFKREQHIEDTIKDALLSEKMVREPQTATGTFIKDIGEFTIGMATAGKLFGVANKTFQGGVAAWTVFDPQKGRLSDLIQKYPALRNPVTNFLKSDPGDSAMESRLKNAFEGVAQGKVVEGFVRGLNLLRTSMRAQVAKQAFEIAPGETKPRVQITGTDTRTGKPRIRLVEQGQQEAKLEMASQAAAGRTPDLGAGVAKSAEAVAEETKGPKPATPSQSLEKAFTPATLAERARGALQEWWRWTRQSLAPGSVSPAAKQAEADIASAYAEHAQHVEEQFQRSPERKEYWDTNQSKVPQFVRNYETGEPMGGTGPVPKGMVRYYHGGSPGQTTGPLWFTSSLQDAKGWASRSPGMKIWHVDVPEGHPVRGEGDLSQGIPYPSRVEMPAEIANQRRPFVEGKTDPVLERARAFYKDWMSRVEAKEKAAGVEYEAEDHYIPHLFQDQKGVQEWLRKSGAKVAKFAKERTFDLYEQAVKAGFKPRFTNPEDIFQARQHASDLALAKIDALKRLSESGLAIEGEEGKGHFRTSYSTPDGKTWWVHDDAKLLLNRMFDERSLWSDRSPIGSAYRGMVALKNNIIPVRLAFSLFHPLHVLSMHLLAASATRSFKAGEWMPSRYSEGSRMLKMLRGEIPNGQLSSTDRQALQYVAEGGLILEQDPRYRTQALERLRTEFVNANPKALLHIHTGALQTIQNIVFKTWIPSLKGASYLADVRAAIKAQPNLIDDAAARRVALRRIAKSVENRYGEMNYSTLFWNRIFRDVSVLSATSMGWQLGLFREYGGGAGQLANALGKIALNPRNGKEIFNSLRKSGDLDKLVYIANYTTLAATLGGLTTWAMTGSRPKEWMDYFAPRTGEQNPDGTPSRVRTMFYPYEFAAVGKRIQHEGPTKAAEEWLSAKGTGIPSMLAETWTGVDGLGRHIRDENGTPMEQARQTLDAILRENMPISLQQKGAEPESTKQRLLDVAGMTKAPKYLQETTAEAQIEQLWEKQYKPAETPFQKGVKSAERQKLQAAMRSGDNAAADKILPQMVERFNLRAQDAKRLAKDAALGTTSHQALFKEMSQDDQLRLLRSMPAEERQKYLPYAKRRVQAEFSE
jgi:hypothetical protein